MSSQGLSELALRISYGTGRDNLVADFYSPCLRRSNLYRRAVGYFTSNGLALAAQGVAHLIENGGRIRLIASPHLAEEDVEAINRGYREREAVLREATRRALKEVRDELTADRLNALAWLIASDRLDVRLALRVTPDGQIARGIFHEKTGIFSDSLGNSVAFSGSSNETVGGLVDNFEVVDVFWSWDDPHKRVQQKIKHFDTLWKSQTPGLEVVEFTDASRELLETYRRADPPTRDPAEHETSPPERNRRAPAVPGSIVLRDYQEAARQQWFANHGRGVLKMATGSGKTITALSIAARLAEEVELEAMIVVCPFRHLVTQWERECRRFGMEPLLAFQSRNRWFGPLSDALYATRDEGNRRFLSVITTNATFASAAFQSQLANFPRRTLLIADEVHNLGATNLRECLPESVGLRLGLSATPERWFDDSGTAELFQYFGPVLQPELTLQDALEAGALCSYRYYPILVDLTEDEHREYIRISAELARVASSVKSDESDERLTALLVRRARLVAHAENKLGALRALMTDKLHQTHMLFYCGDGTVEHPMDDAEVRHVEAVCVVLGRELGFRVSTYTAEESLEERESLRRRFESGELQGLVAIRCLDEGVDIPAIQSAVILASSTNPRQFIQRRGRILRPAPEKESAEIYDLIVVPPIETAKSELERSLLRKELTRFAEFADLALNSGEARSTIFELQKTFDLMDV